MSEICLFIPKSVKFSIVTTENPMYYDILAVDLFTVNEVIRIISVYAPPSLKIGEYEKLMEEIKLLAVQHKIIIVGHFNLGNIK
uniref:Endonuclease/exonuclease/phosphatase domain-containing protein n=1 Tax=Panagrolaimus sp. JU765 TaxID=591449 RepID=A0AC34PYG3_9BILA